MLRPREVGSKVATRPAPAPTSTLDRDDPALKRSERQRRSYEPGKKKGKEPPKAPAQPEKWERDQAEAHKKTPEDTQAMRDGRERWRQRQEELKTPEARRRRRESRDRHRKLDRAQSLDVARQEFPELVEAPALDPLPLKPGDEVLSFDGPSSALLETEVDGERKKLFVQSQGPLRSSEGSGKPELIDLKLRDRGSVYEPENPAVPTQIGKTVRQGVKLPDANIGVTAAGGSEPVQLVKDKLFFANTSTDMDVLVTPQPEGVEFSWQVRSAASPEGGRLAFDLPAGASLRTDDKVGGAEVVKGDKPLATIAPPAAVDADGQAVPVSYRVDDSDLVVEFPHRDGDWKYPIMVDPAVAQYNLDQDGTYYDSTYCDQQVAYPNKWWGFSTQGGFNSTGPDTWSNNAWNASESRAAGACALTIAPNGRTPFPQNGHHVAYWEHLAPRQSTIWSAHFRARHIEGYSCLFEGLLAGGGGRWEAGYWNDNDPRTSGSSPWIYNGSCTSFWDDSKAHYGERTPGNAAAVGMEMQGNPQYNVRWPYFQLLGSLLYLEDFEAPELTVNHSALPTGWAHRVADTVSASALDATKTPVRRGLGVRYFLGYVPNGSDSSDPTKAGYRAVSQDFNCGDPKWTRCPYHNDPGYWGQEGRGAAFGYSYDTDSVPEGVLQNYLSAVDLTDKASNPGSGTWTTKIDRSPPETLSASGSLGGASNRWVKDNAQTLKLTGADKYSGIKKLGYEIRQGSATGPVVKSGSQTSSQCHPDNGCPTGQDQTFDVDLAGLSEGPYVVVYSAEDQVFEGAASSNKAAHRVEKQFRFGIDRTAPRIDSVNTAPPRWLKDGDPATTTVNATDIGPAGGKSVSLAFPGGAGPAPISQSCGGVAAGDSPPPCSPAVSGGFPYSVDSTRFPNEGRVTVTGKATDAAGNESAPATGDVRVDRSAPTVETGGDLYASRNLILVKDRYQLTFTARDGSSASAAQERSGARQVRVLVKKEAPGEQFVEKYATPSADCPAGSCAVSGDWAFETGRYQENTQYTIRVLATDQLGFESPPQDFKVWVGKALGSASPLLVDRNGLEEFWNYDSTETGAGTRAHVNLQNGNLVWHSVPLVNPGRGLSTVANLTYNSQETAEDALIPETPVGDALGQYNQVGRGFSLGVSGLTRVNDHLDLGKLATGEVRLTDVDGTRHTFTSGDGCRTFAKPAGVHLRLRRFSPGKLVEPGCGLASGGLVQDPRRAWAATRPDGVTHFFDARGYQTGIEDRNGNRLSFKYEFRGVTGSACTVGDGDGVLPDGAMVDDAVCPRRLVSVEDPENQLLTLSYYPNNALEGSSQASGPVKDIVDHAGRVMHFDYDSNGYLQKMTQAQGTDAARSFGFGYEAGATGTELLRRRALNEITDPVGMKTAAAGDGTTKIAYESDGDPALGGAGDGLTSRKRVKRISNRRLKQRSFDYSRTVEEGKPVDKATVTDALSRRWLHSMDDLGRPTRQTDPKLTETKLDWDGSNNLFKLTDALGTSDEAVTDMTYNANGLLESQTTHPKAGEDRRRELVYKNTSGKHIAGAQGVNDSTGAFVSDLTEVKNPKPGTGWTFGLDDRGNVTSRTDAKGRSALTSYDAFGRIYREEDEQHNVTRYSDFDKTGQPKVMIDPRSADTGSSDSEHRWIYGYDLVGNVLSVTDPRGAKSGGPDDSRSDFTTRLSYDALDRLKTESTPKDTAGAADERITRIRGYDANDNVVSSVDGEGKTTALEYTEMDKPKTVTAPGSRGSEVTRYGYDDLDQLTSRVDPKGSGTGLAYTTQYVLDDLGRRAAEVRNAPGETPDKLITSYSFDRRDNVVGVVDAKRNAGRSAQEATAAAEAPSSRRTTFAYNAVDEQIDKLDKPAGSDGTDVEPLHVTYKYDANGNRTEETSPRSADWVTRYGFDHRDQLIDVTNQAGERTHYTRREDGKVVAKTTPRGVSGDPTEPIAPGSAINTYKYSTTRYEYDRNGDLAARSIPFVKDQYGRSDADLQAWKVKYDRDAAGNPKTITDARGNSFGNSFYDTGDIRSTGRPSWWKPDWGDEKFDAPDPGQRFKDQGSAVDSELATGGPKLVENEERSTNAQKTEQTPKLPDSESSGNFGSVDPEELPGLLPAAGNTQFSYDGEMRLKSVSDQDSNARSITYDDAGRITAKSWPFKPGERIGHSYEYDPNGNLMSYVDGRGKKTTFGYDGYDRRNSETTPGASSAAGQDPEAATEVTRYAYDPNGNLTGRQTPLGPSRKFTFGYDSFDRLKSEANPAGDTWTYQSDAAGNRVLERSPRGKSDPLSSPSIYDTKSHFDAADRPDKLTDGDGNDTEFSYDPDGNRTQVKAPGAQMEASGEIEPRVTSTEYDGRGLPWKEDKGQSETKRRTVKEFDANGNLRRIVNPKGLNDSGLPSYTDNGQSSGDNLKNATKHATVRLYTDDDLVSEEFMPWGDRDARDQRRFTQKWSRDPRGRVKSAFSPYEVGAASAPQRSYEYFDTDWINSSSDEEVHNPDPPNPAIGKELVAYDYDKGGNQTRWKSAHTGDPRGREVNRSFYPNGLLKTRSAEKVLESDGRDERTKRSYAYFYNANRSLTQMDDTNPARPADQRLRTTRISRDAAEREAVVNETWASGKDTVFSYDEAGNVKKRQTDGRYDSSNGNYVSSVGGRQDAKTTTFSYDRLEREKTSSTVQGSDPSRSVERGYWPSGDLKTKLVRKPGTGNNVVEERYYNRQGEPAKIRRKREGASGWPLKDQDYSYDTNGNRTVDERGEHAFNARDQLVWWKRGAKQKKPETEVRYDLGATGEIKTKTDTARPADDRTVSYSYDGTRLDKVTDKDTTQKYSYDDFGSVTRIQSSLNAGGTLFPPVNNLPDGLPPACEGQVSGADAGTTLYCFDEFERMVTARGPGLDKDTAVYDYDGFDRRDTKLERTSGGSDKRRDFAYVGTSRLLSREQSPEGKTMYYDYSAAGEREGQSKAPAGQSEPTVYRSYGTDANGSVEDLEEENGEVPDDNKYVYDPYGERDTAAGQEGDDGLSDAAKDNPFRFEGFYYDSGVKTYDMQARQYRADTGRFLTQDRYESASGDLNLQADPLTQNRYAFAGGNPLNNIEFDGHAFKDDIDAKVVNKNKPRARKRIRQTNAWANNGGYGADGPTARGTVGSGAARGSGGSRAARALPPRIVALSFTAALMRAGAGERADASVAAFKATHLNPDQGVTSRTLEDTRNYNGQPCTSQGANSGGACTPYLENGGVGSAIFRGLTKLGIFSSAARLGPQGAKILAGVRAKALKQAGSGGRLVAARGEYVGRVSSIEGLVASSRRSGLSWEGAARRAVDSRNAIRADVRERLGPLPRGALRGLDMLRSPKTAESLYAKYGSWQEVASAASRTNPRYNRWFGPSP